MCESVSVCVCVCACVLGYSIFFNCTPCVLMTSQIFLHAYTRVSVCVWACECVSVCVSVCVCAHVYVGACNLCSIQ